MPDEVPLPLPLPDPDSQEYWDGAKRHELLIQRNKVNGEFRFPPGPMVDIPGVQEWEWARSSGKGTVYSYCVPHYPAHPYFRDKVPYNVVVVEMEEGVRIVGNLLDIDHDAIEIGMPVEVVFQDVAEDLALPQFRPAA
ncbi:MAG: OB-fold domain-containing protein [Dehalococcoidia bacterium]